MPNSGVPFHAQAAILDRYIHSSNPKADPGALEVISEMLRSHQDLRDYFFRSGPNAAWAEILWENGFFDNPPSPQETEGGVAFPRWDVQEYLIAVAGQVPEIVIKHVQSIQAQGWYLSRAIQALCYVPMEKVEGVVSRIVEWLRDEKIAHNISPETFELIKKLAQKGQTEAAFTLFRELTAPMPPSEVRTLDTLTLGAEAESKFKSTRIREDVLSKGVELLVNLDIQRMVMVLGDNLCAALRLEAIAMNSPEAESTSWWRAAIEDTGQDLWGRHYKDELLRALRDALESWVRKDAVAAEPVVRRYLGEGCEILRRLGLHTLCRFPAKYQPYVVSELHKMENLDDTGIHHEFFMLLQKGYPYLESQDQEKLIDAICSGPPAKRIEKIIESAPSRCAEDTNKYIRQRIQAWIRDRLWMLRDYLASQPERLLMLKELVEELGAPEHPAFLVWSTRGEWVQEVSPITEREMAQMAPDELLAFVRQWQPTSDRVFGLEHVSYRGLADEVTKVIVANLLKYTDQLVPIATHHPELASALLRRFTEGEQASTVPWELSIGLCQGLLTDEIVRTDMGRAFYGSWVEVRKSIVRLLQVGLNLNNPDRAIPEEYLPQVRDILLILVDDPDPVPDDDQPAEGWLGYNDPATLALNYVRPSALSALIEYAWFRARLDKEGAQESTPTGPGSKRLEVVVKQTLARRLDRDVDPSWAVHSVYGRYLIWLYCWDQKWVESHIDDVFPEGDDEQSVRFYVAAWDSYVVFNRPSYHYHALFEMMRPKYEQAIYNLSQGYVTKAHLGPDRGLAIHLVWDYLNSDYDMQSPDGQQSLLAIFFRQVPPEARGGAVWALWRICDENPTELKETCWPKAQSLWIWRAREASRLNHSVDFDEEMRWFAHLLPIAPESETVTSLWPLLEALLPHITRSPDRDRGWKSVEDYLAREVEREPLKVIQFYRLMCEQRRQSPWTHRRQEKARKIIETAAEHTSSRQEALSLIDWLARSGEHQYRDIYERYAG